MQNRWSERKKTNLHIAINFRGSGHTNASVRDISLGGVALDMERASDSLVEENIELMFKSDDPVIANHLFHATVLGEDDAGIRCKFTNVGTKDFLVLKKVIASV